MSNRPHDWWVVDDRRHSDPTPGDPQVLHLLARSLTKTADRAAEAAAELRSLGSSSSVDFWVGEAGDTFKHHIGKLPGQLDKVRTSYALAARAVGHYADQLAQYQSQADRALARARDHRHARDRGAATFHERSQDRAAAHSHYEQLTRAVPPDPAQVSAALRRYQDLDAAVSLAQRQRDDAQAVLDTSASLIEQAAQLQNDAADTAVRALRNAKDAAIAPDSRWTKFKGAVSKAWHAVIAVAKIVVAVGSILALVLGGPLTWIVLAAAVLVLLDTVGKYARGEASLWDVGLAVLNCIPVTRLKLIEDLGSAWRTGRLLGANGVLLTIGAKSRNLWQGGKAILQGGREMLANPRMVIAAVRALPRTGVGLLQDMTAQLRYTAPGVWRQTRIGLQGGTGLVGRLQAGFNGAKAGYRDGTIVFQLSVHLNADAALAARFEQRGAAYFTDVWRQETFPAGTTFDAVYPGLSGFVSPGGTMAAHGFDATSYSQALQIAPGNVGQFAHDFRTLGVQMHTTTAVEGATSHALANTQYGAGGSLQHFLPDVPGLVHSNAVVFTDTAGQAIPATVHHGVVTLHAPSGQLFTLNNADLASGSPVLRPDKVHTFLHGFSTANVGGQVVAGTAWDGYGVYGPAKDTGDIVFPDDSVHLVR